MAPTSADESSDEAETLEFATQLLRRGRTQMNSVRGSQAKSRRSTNDLRDVGDLSSLAGAAATVDFSLADDLEDSVDGAQHEGVLTNEKTPSDDQETDLHLPDDREDYIGLAQRKGTLANETTPSHDQETATDALPESTDFLHSANENVHEDGEKSRSRSESSSSYGSLPERIPSCPTSPRADRISLQDRAEPDGNDPALTMSNAAAEAWSRQFDALLPVKPGRQQRISGGRMKETMEASGLDRRALSAIWKLSDYDNDGYLDRGEFLICMWLLRFCVTGHELPLIWNDIPQQVRMTAGFAPGAVKEVFSASAFVAPKYSAPIPPVDNISSDKRQPQPEAPQEPAPLASNPPAIDQERDQCAAKVDPTSVQDAIDTGIANEDFSRAKLDSDESDQHESSSSFKRRSEAAITSEEMSSLEDQVTNDTAFDMSDNILRGQEAQDLPSSIAKSTHGESSTMSEDDLLGAASAALSEPSLSSHSCSRDSIVVKENNSQVDESPTVNADASTKELPKAIPQFKKPQLEKSNSLNGEMASSSSSPARRKLYASSMAPYGARRGTVAKLLRLQPSDNDREEILGMLPRGFCSLGVLPEVPDIGVLGFISAEHVDSNDMIRTAQALDDVTVDGLEKLTAGPYRTLELLKAMAALKSHSSNARQADALAQAQTERRLALRSVTSNIWLRSSEHVGVANSLTQIVRHLVVSDEAGSVVLGDVDPLGDLPDAGLLQVMLHRSLRSLFEQVAIILSDMSTLAAVIQRYDEHGHPADASNGVKDFIASELAEDVSVDDSHGSKTLRLFKAVTQSVLVAPYSELKRHFEMLDCYFIDAALAWRVHIAVGENRIVVTHVKGAQSSAASALTVLRSAAGNHPSQSTIDRILQLETQAFQFVWAFRIEFNATLEKVTGVFLSLPWIGYTKRLHRSTKRALHAIRELYHPDAITSATRPTESPTLSSPDIGVAHALPTDSRAGGLDPRRQLHRKMSAAGALMAGSTQLSRRQSRSLGFRSAKAVSLLMAEQADAADAIGKLVRSWTPLDEKFVAETLGRASRLYCAWGTCLTDSTRRLKNRLLVLSEHRVILISSPRTGRKVLCRMHLFSLIRIDTMESGHISLDFRLPPGFPSIPSSTAGISVSPEADGATRVTLSFNCPGIGDELPPLLLSARREMCQGFPLEHQVQFVIKPVSRVRELAPPPTGLGGGLVETYRGWCDYLQDFAKCQAPQQSFEQLAVSLARAEIDTFDLGMLPGLDASASPESVYYQIETLPIANALRYNSFFRGIKLHGVRQPGALKHFAAVLRHSSHLTSLEISDVGIANGAGVAEIGEALVVNKLSVLCTLDLNGCVLRDKGANHLAAGISASKHLQVLRLADGKLTSTATAEIINAIASNSMVSVHLSELNLSGNSFQNEGTNALVSWLNSKESDANSPAAPNYSLRVLHLVDCELVMDLLFNSLARSSSRHSIEQFSVAENPITRVGEFDAICAFMETATSLELLDISSCRLANLPLGSLVDCICLNPWLRGLSLRLNGDSLSAGTSSSLVNGISRTCELRSELFGSHSSETCAEKGDAKIVYDDSLLLAPSVRNKAARRGRSASHADVVHSDSLTLSQSLPSWCLQPGASISSLSLCNASLSGNVLIAIVRACKGSPLRKLDLSGNCLGKKESGWPRLFLQAIEELLTCRAYGAYLLDLSISRMALCASVDDQEWNAIDDCEFAIEVAEDTELVEIARQVNKLCNCPAAILHPLARALQNSSCQLERLDVSRNLIRDGGAIELATALALNTSLKELNWDGNDINYAGWTAIEGTLRSNFTLTKIFGKRISTRSSSMPNSAQDCLVEAAESRLSHFDRYADILSFRLERNQDASVCPAAGISQQLNPKCQFVLEDRASILHGRSMDTLLCVDGHGGQAVADTVIQALPVLLMRQMHDYAIKNLHASAVEGVLFSAFLQCDALVNHLALNRGGASVCCAVIRSGPISHFDSSSNFVDRPGECYDSSFVSYRSRLSSFVTWQLSAPAPEELARSGFYADPSPERPDTVRCFLCGCKLFDWEEGDEPEFAHRQSSPSCVVLQHSKWLHLANVGDTRAVIIRKGNELVHLSRTHTVADSDERRRVEATGHALSEDRLGGRSNLTRAIGDLDLKPFGIKPDPDCMSRELQFGDEYLLLATGSLFKVCSDRMILDALVSVKEPTRIARRLTRLALQNGSEENVSVVVAELPDV